jgi:hypothetical protein
MDKYTEISDFFISLFVEKRELFTPAILEINKNIKDILKVNYQYDYDSFCNDFLTLIIDFFKRHPDLDYSDINTLGYYINIIIGELFLNIKIKHGNEKRID